jgi:glycosyltransferase involved in cell wall biosynthesis
LYAAEMSKLRRTDGLVLVVPKAGSEVAEHFAHTFRLAAHVRLHMRTAVIIERLAGTRPVAHESVDVRIQRHADGGFLRRAWELAWLAIRLNRDGYRSFFVRTSQTAAVPLIVVRRLLGGRVMYWSCGEIPKPRLRDVGLRTALQSEVPRRLAFRWADTVVTGTASLADRYSTNYGIPRERMTVLPNEIDLEWFTPASANERRRTRSALGVSEDERLVLSVHRFSPIRRTSLYVPSVPEAVLREDERARFVLAGGGPDEAGLRADVQRAGLSDRVQILGTVPHDRVRELYAAADVFMMPSYTEGFPRVLLEAMAMGVPIASTDVGGVREVLPSAYGNRLVDRDRPLELARAVSELVQDPGLAQELAAMGRGWVHRFDAPSVARQLAALAMP